MTTILTILLNQYSINTHDRYDLTSQLASQQVSKPRPRLLCNGFGEITVVSSSQMAGQLARINYQAKHKTIDKLVSDKLLYGYVTIYVNSYDYRSICNQSTFLLSYSIGKFVQRQVNSRQLQWFLHNSTRRKFFSYSHMRRLPSTIQSARL